MAGVRPRVRAAVPELRRLGRHPRRRLPPGRHAGGGRTPTTRSRRGSIRRRYPIPDGFSISGNFFRLVTFSLPYNDGNFPYLAEIWQYLAGAGIDQGGHGVYLITDAPCAGNVATAFLLDGTVPAHDQLCARQTPAAVDARRRTVPIRLPGPIG